MAAKNHFNQEHGQGLVEYALILVLVGIMTIIALTLMGESVSVGMEEGYLAVSYPKFNDLIDHCMEDAGNGQINSLKNQVTDNPDTYINRVNGLIEDGTITQACGNRMVEYAGVGSGG
jgi:Flp pilus assembly pilin Flp